VNGIQLSPLLALMLAWFGAEGMVRATGLYAGPRLQALLTAWLFHGLFAWIALWLTTALPVHALIYGVLLSVYFVLGRMVVGPYARERAPGVTQSLLEFAAITVVWIVVSDQWGLLAAGIEALSNTRVLLVLLAYVLVIWPLSFLVGWVCKPWADVAVDASALPKAGAWIGMLERVLVLTFILLDEMAAIGFLLAAKSILRFGGTQEKDHRKLTEYVLIGTLASFTVTILLGILVRWLLFHG